MYVRLGPTTQNVGKRFFLGAPTARRRRAQMSVAVRDAHHLRFPTCARTHAASRHMASIDVLPVEIPVGVRRRRRPSVDLGAPPRCKRARRDDAVTTDSMPMPPPPPPPPSPTDDPSVVTRKRTWADAANDATAAKRPCLDTPAERERRAAQALGARLREAQLDVLSRLSGLDQETRTAIADDIGQMARISKRIWNILLDKNVLPATTTTAATTTNEDAAVDALVHQITASRLDDDGDAADTDASCSYIT